MTKKTWTVTADWDANAPDHVMARFTTEAEANKYRDAMWKDHDENYRDENKQTYCHPYVEGWEFMKNYTVSHEEPIIYTTAETALKEEIDTFDYTGQTAPKEETET